MKFIVTSIFLLLFVIPMSANQIPPELIIKKEDQKVKLSWDAELKEEISHFILEKSENAIVFRELAILTKPTVEDGNTYVHVDELPTEGERYYRLKVIAKDGGSVYSKVVRVN